MWTAKYNIWTHKCFEPFVQSPLTYNKEAQQMKAICRMIELLISLCSVSKLQCILCEYTIKSLMLARQITKLICLCPIHWSQALNSEWRCSWSSADNAAADLATQGSTTRNYDTFNRLSSLWLSFYEGRFKRSTDHKHKMKLHLSNICRTYAHNP